MSTTLEKIIKELYPEEFDLLSDYFNQSIPRHKVEDPAIEFCSSRGISISEFSVKIRNIKKGVIQLIYEESDTINKNNLFFS